jgi:hypothetical protein
MARFSAAQLIKIAHTGAQLVTLRGLGYLLKAST